MSKTVFITTPIYYVNSVPHIGTALTTMLADVSARYHRMLGHDVKFLSGTDENALKVHEAAQAKGRDTLDYVNEISDEFRKIFKEMNFSIDDFIRTTEPRHHKTVQHFIDTLKANGHLYTDKYEGWYDVSSETFFREADLIDGKSPDGNPVRWVSEENLFFRMSSFGERLLDHIEANPDFISPEVRKNEVVAFVKEGLRDVCITRKNPGWGIPDSQNPDWVIYVWFDALINYATSAGWPDAGYEKYWPADVQWMGKDILTRFHATFWPAMLMGVGLPLPKKLIGHGWILMNGSKISKSKGNTVDPVALSKALGERTGGEPEIMIDAVRYYMAATTPYESDGSFTDDEFDRKYNAELANDLGNATNRTISMAHKFVEGIVPDAPSDTEVIEAIAIAKAAYELHMVDYRIERATDQAMSLVRFLNKYIDIKAPWVMAKNADPKLPEVVRSMLLILRSVEGMLRPIMPKTADRMAEQLGLTPLNHWAEIGTEESLASGILLSSPVPIFPRIDPKKTQAMNEQIASEKPAEPAATPATAAKESTKAAPVYEEITIQDFMKVQLKVARILECEPVEGSTKLVKLQVMIGEEKRQILAGIKKSYEPADLVGRQVIVVANLKPAKLMGLESQGMILAADGPDGQAILLQPDIEAPEGTSVH